MLNLIRSVVLCHSVLVRTCLAYILQLIMLDAPRSWSSVLETDEGLQILWKAAAKPGVQYGVQGGIPFGNFGNGVDEARCGPLNVSVTYVNMYRLEGWREQG